jgi:hypothetical protein
MNKSRWKVGDVLRIGGLWGQHNRIGARYATPSNPAWAITTREPQNRGAAWADLIWLINPSPRRTGIGRDDIVTVVPPEEWPDEVCVAVAKYRMENA